ncbi:MAG: DUF202 domain-containing protein [Myxococcota bacterium]
MTDDSLENVGASARDHLASERTFLAWNRTALGVMGLAVLLEKFATDGGPLITGAALVLLAYAAAMLTYAMVRYRNVERLLIAGRFPPARKGPLVVGGVGLLLAACAAAYVILHG